MQVIIDPTPYYYKNQMYKLYRCDCGLVRILRYPAGLRCMGCKALRQMKPDGISHTAAYQAAQHVASSNRMRDRKREWVLSYLATHPCVDCGETDPVVLDFDHRNTDDKHQNISKMINNSWSLTALKIEIAKCDVRCANDHRRRHYRERNCEFNRWNKLASPSVK